MRVDEIFDLFLDLFIGLVVTPIFCMMVAPYILYKAFFEEGRYWDNVIVLYKKHVL